MSFFKEFSVFICSYSSFLAGLDGGDRGRGSVPQSKRQKRRKKPLSELEDGQSLSRASMEVLQGEERGEE